jgi:hypothetical protein
MNYNAEDDGFDDYTEKPTTKDWSKIKTGPGGEVEQDVIDKMLEADKSLERENLLSEKEKLEAELNRVNERLENIKIKDELRSRFEEGKWYEYFVALGMPSAIFKFSKEDFVRDGMFWAHQCFTKTITRMQSSFSIQDIYWIPVDCMTKENVKEIDELLVDDMLEEEIKRIKALRG